MAFADRSMEERFLSQHRDDTAAYLRWACVLGAAIMLGFLWQDTLISTSGRTASNLRIFGALPISALVWYLSRRLGVRRYISYISAFFWLSYACLTAGIFLAYGPGPFGLTSTVGVGSFFIVLVGVFTFSNLRFWAALPVGLLILLVYTVSVALWTDVDIGEFLMGDFLTAVALVAGTAAKTLFTDRARRRLFETSELLREAYAGVEQQVRERTSELQVINTHLAAEIAVRERAEKEHARLEGQLRQSQKMDTVGRLAGGVAHDFNNMLGVILGHVEMAIEQVGPEHPLHSDLQEIRNAAARSADLTRQLLAFARKQTIAPKVLDLNQTVAGMITMLQRLIGEDIRLVWQPGAGLWQVNVDPSQIDQILANLCVNARDAIGGVGNATIETANIGFDEGFCRNHVGFVPGEYVLLTVSDDGSGMDADTLGKLFEPFFTTKETGKGTGLGLATVYGIVKQNHGFINVESERHQGTTFRVYLPRHVGRAEQVRTEIPREPLVQGEETVLVVEDEPSLLNLSKLLLEKQGYRVLSAGTPGEAIRLAAEHPGQIHLLMTDVVMPEMNGRELAQKLLALYPHLKCLFTSGYTADIIAHHGVLDDRAYFIQKPFSRRDLTAKVQEALHQKLAPEYRQIE